MNDKVHPWSRITLRLQPIFDGKPSGVATGMLIYAKGRFFLLTNDHVLSATHPATGVHSSSHPPEAIRIWQHRPHGPAQPFDQPLRNKDGAPCWHEFTQKRLSANDDQRLAVDLALLELNKSPHWYPAYCLDWHSYLTEQRIEPGSQVHILGFPRGIDGVKDFPIWKTGNVAADIYAHHDRKHFLIDATTYEGMSGAPVLRPSDWQSSFLGVYSGRLVASKEFAPKKISTDSAHTAEDDGTAHIGVVWRAWVVQELLFQALGGCPKDWPKPLLASH